MGELGARRDRCYSRCLKGRDRSWPSNPFETNSEPRTTGGWEETGVADTKDRETPLKAIVS